MTTDAFYFILHFTALLLIHYEAAANFTGMQGWCHVISPDFAASYIAMQCTIVLHFNAMQEKYNIGLRYLDVVIQCNAMHLTQKCNV